MRVKENPEALCKSRHSRGRDRLCTGGCFTKEPHDKAKGTEEPGGGQGVWGVGARACRNLNFQTYGGGGGRGLPGPNPELFTEFYVFWVLPGGSFPPSSVRLRHIFVIPESGPLLCGLDRQTGWLGLPGEGNAPPPS